MMRAELRVLYWAGPHFCMKSGPCGVTPHPLFAQHCDQSFARAFLVLYRTSLDAATAARSPPAAPARNAAVTSVDAAPATGFVKSFRRHTAEYPDRSAAGHWRRLSGFPFALQSRAACAGVLPHSVLFPLALRCSETNPDPDIPAALFHKHWSGAQCALLTH